MKIMTYNIQHCYNYILEKVDYEMLAKEIKNINPDIVGINEIYGEDESSFYGNQVEKLAELAGYDYFYFAKAFDHDKGPYGNALFSKIPIVNAQTIVIPSPEIKKNLDGYYEQRCLLVAELANGKRVIVTHFGLNIDEVEKEVEVLLEYLSDTNCIFMGDLNSLPDDDVLNPIKLVMKDTATDFCGDTLTFASFEPKIKIDYIFVSFDLEIKNAYAIEKVLSDHFAYVAEIE